MQIERHFLKTRRKTYNNKIAHYSKRSFSSFSKMKIIISKDADKDCSITGINLAPSKRIARG